MGPRTAPRNVVVTGILIARWFTVGRLAKNMNEREEFVAGRVRVRKGNGARATRTQ